MNNVNVSGPIQPTATYKTKVLKGNHSFASQVTEPNMKYVIKHDFVLDGDVTIPENCILEFDGGSISGEHTITGNNTGIEAGLVKIFGTDANIAGSWNIAEAYPEWVDLDYEKCANVFKSITFTGYYTISKQIEIANIVHIEIKDKASITIADNFIGNHLFYIHSNESIINRQKNIVISGSGKTWLSNRCGFIKTNVTCCVWLKGLLVYDVGGNEPAVFIERGEPIIEGCSFAAKPIVGESEYQNVPQYMIWGLGDALINDVIVVTPHTAIRMQFCSCFNNIHIWWGQNQVPSAQTPVYTKVGLELGISSFCVNNYYADNIQTIFKFFDSEGHSPEETNLVYPTITATNVILGNWYSNDSFNYTFVYSERLLMPLGSISYNADRNLPQNFVFHNYNGQDITNIRSNIRFIGTSNYRAALYSPIHDKARVAGEIAVSEYINEIGYSNLKGEYLPIGIDFSYVDASSYYCISFDKTLLSVVDIDIAFFKTGDAKQSKIKLLGYTSNFTYVSIYKNISNPINVKTKTDGNTVFVYLNTGINGLFVIRNGSNFILSKVEIINNLPEGVANVSNGEFPKFGTNRPTLSQYYDKGYMFFDESLSPARPIWWNGSAWVDATGATV